MRIGYKFIDFGSRSKHATLHFKVYRIENTHLFSYFSGSCIVVCRFFTVSIFENFFHYSKFKCSLFTYETTEGVTQIFQTSRHIASFLSATVSKQLKAAANTPIARIELSPDIISWSPVLCSSRITNPTKISLENWEIVRQIFEIYFTLLILHFIFYFSFRFNILHFRYEFKEFYFYICENESILFTILYKNHFYIQI